MVRKRHTDEDVLKLLREIELKLAVVRAIFEKLRNADKVVLSRFW